MSVLNEYDDEIVLVTGGAGCVGSNLTPKLAELNAEKVIILDNLSSAYKWNIPSNWEKIEKSAEFDVKTNKESVKDNQKYEIDSNDDITCSRV